MFANRRVDLSPILKDSNEHKSGQEYEFDESFRRFMPLIAWLWYG